MGRYGSTAGWMQKSNYQIDLMERNTVTQLKCLQNGDRFYLQNDRKKEVRVKVERPPKRTYYRNYHYWSLCATIYDRFQSGAVKQVAEIHYKPHNGDVAVVFLRHETLSNTKLPNE